MRIANILLKYAYLSSLWFSGALLAATVASLLLAGSYGALGLSLTSGLFAVTSIAVFGGMAMTAVGWIAYRRAAALLQRPAPSQPKARGAALAEIG